MAWIFFTLLAAFMQSGRNALQSRLSAEVSTSGVTLARFVFASPIAFLYLSGLYIFSPQIFPEFSSAFLTYILVASCLQIIATALMVVLFKQKNFSVGAGLAKSEALVAGVIGMLFFGSQLSVLGWVGILVGTLAVFVLSGVLKKGSFSFSTVIIGLACGASFAMTSLYIREASLALNLPFPHNAAWVLLLVLCIQTVLLTIYIAYTEPRTFGQLKLHKKLTVATSFTSCIGSIGWFSAMSLQYVAYVKTLGQIEVLFTILLSTLWLKQRVRAHEFAGLLLISLAAVLVMWQ
ncbi:EamA family transporter [Agaribacter flavus]|uniref:Multidrug transporter n=1 Tax=Agaribacter flavus TaxID=1902781 RepID=A0ABV7FS49_9ALTE